MALLVEDRFDQEGFGFWWFAGAGASIVGDRARLACSTSYNGSLVSDPFSALKGSTWTVEAPVLADTSKSSTETFFQVQIDEKNALWIWVSEGLIRFRELADAASSTTTLTYNAVAHRRWGIKVDAAGKVFWQTSPDGKEWTTRREKESAIALDREAHVRLRTGTWAAAELAPAYTEFDNLAVDIEWEDFKGDAESGDFSAFVNVQAPEGRATVVESPVAEGQFAYRLELQPGDVEPETGNHRAELISGRKFVAGERRRHRTLFRIDAWDFGVWGLIRQSRTSKGTNPPVCLQIEPVTKKILTSHGNGEDIYWEGPELVLGRWYEVVEDILYHPTEGEVRVWLNGVEQEMLASTGLATMGASFSYDKAGPYRDSAATEPADVYIDGYRITTEFFSDPPQVGAPQAVTGVADSLSFTSARLNGTVDANLLPTSYYFEYGETEAYGSKVPAGEDGDAGENAAAVAVNEALSGLKPNTTYHFRLVAVNVEGESVGEDAEFTISKAPRVAVAREYPPARHTVIVRDPKTGAPIARWAEDENRPHNVYEGLSLSGALQGGDKEMSLNLGRDPRADYPDIQGMLDVECQLPGREVIWEGRHGKDQRSSGERSEIGLEAVGHAAAMEDRKGIKAGIIDCDLGKWGEPSTARRKQLYDLAIRLMASTSVGHSSKDLEAVTAAVINDFTNVEAAATGSETGEAHYYSGGIDIGRVLYDYDQLSNFAATSDWESTMRLGTTDLFTTAAGTSDHQRTNALLEQQSVDAPDGGYQFARLRDRFVSTATGALADLIAWRHIKVLSLLATERIGPPQGTWPDVGYTAAQMLAALIPEFSYLELGQLDDDGFIIPQAWWGEGGTTLAQIVAEITRYGLYDYRVRGKRFELREPGTYGERWIAPRDTTQLEEAGEDSERCWDRIVVNFSDPSGRTGSVGYPDSGADEEFAELQITDPDHPAVRTGRPREEALDLQVITSHTRAKEVGERWLKEANELSRAGKATLEGYVQSERGVWHPVAKVREGDLLRIPGARDRGYRKVVDYSYDAVRRQKSLSLDAPSEGLAALLERFRAVLVPMGVG